MSNMNPVVLLRKGAVLLIGSTVICLGIIMLVVPGPGLVVIPAGIAILAIEFVWAKSLLEKFSKLAKEGKRRWDAWRNKNT